MSTDILRVGTSALNAAYAQLQTTGHNIANAATPGYTRREVLLQDAGSNLGPGGFFGRGVAVADIRRVYDEYLVRETITNESAAAQDRARSGQLERLNALFSEPQAGVGAAFDDLVAAFADVAARPMDMSARTVVLSRADAFATRVRTVDGQIAQLGETANSQMIDDVRRANDTLSALASLNRQLAAGRSVGYEQSELLDRRDQLLTELNSVLRAPAVVAADGTVTVQTVRGEPLLVGANANRLLLSADPLQPDKLQVAIELPGGHGETVRLDQASLGGGTLAGLIQFRDQDLASARARLGQLAASVASEVNRQQTVGVDAAGRPGAAIFALQPPIASGAAGNAGDAQLQVQIADGTRLAASDYVLRFDGDAYTLTRSADGSTTQFDTLPRTIDGLTLSIAAGAMAAGDRFQISAASGFGSGIRALQTSPERLATAVPVTAMRDPANQGNVDAQLRVDSIGASTGTPVTIRFTGAGTFDVVGAGTGDPTGIAYAPGMTVSFNGWTATLSGTPAAGDEIRIAPTADPLADNRNARAMQSLGSARLVDGGTVNDRYAELVGDVGSRGHSASTAATMSKRIVDEAQRLRSQVSGVNLDEEAARLIQYQQAYQAAAKVIRTAHEMFQTLLSSSGGH